MIITSEGKIIGSCWGGVTKGGSGTIPYNTNSVTVAHGLGTTPTFALIAPSNDVTIASGIKVTISGANLIVSYSDGITQPEDGTFDFIVGVN